MNRKKFGIILTVLSITLLTNILFFIYHFYNQKISEEIEDWSNFSNYIGGISSIIISLMTLFTTIFIAFTISKIEESRNDKNLEYAKNKFLRELREKEYANISDSLNNIWEYITLSDRREATDKIYAVVMKFHNFLKYKNYLFPDLNMSKFDSLTSNLNVLHHLGSIELNTDDPKTTQTIQNFIELTESFHNDIQNYILTH